MTTIELRAAESLAYVIPNKIEKLTEAINTLTDVLKTLYEGSVGRLQDVVDNVKERK